MDRLYIELCENLLAEISESEYFSCEISTDPLDDNKADPEYVAREFYAHVVNREPTDNEIEMAVNFHLTCKDTLDRASNLAHETEMKINNLELKETALQADLARVKDVEEILSTFNRQYHEECKMKQSSLMAEIARLNQVVETFEEEMARQEKEVAEDIEKQRESALFKASAQILEEVTAKKDMHIKKLQEKIEILKKDLNDSRLESEKVRNSQYNLITREQALERRKIDLDNENERLKKIEQKYKADQAFWSAKTETDHNALGIISAQEEKIKKQQKEITDLRSRFESPAADDKDARIAILLGQVNWLTEELDRWRPSAAPPSVGHDSDQGEGAQRGRGRGRHGRRRQGRRVWTQEHKKPLSNFLNGNFVMTNVPKSKILSKPVGLSSLSFLSLYKKQFWNNYALTFGIWSIFFDNVVVYCLNCFCCISLAFFSIFFRCSKLLFFADSVRHKYVNAAAALAMPSP